MIESCLTLNCGVFTGISRGGRGDFWILFGFSPEEKIYLPLWFVAKLMTDAVAEVSVGHLCDCELSLPSRIKSRK